MLLLIILFVLIAVILLLIVPITFTFRKSKEIYYEISIGLEMKDVWSQLHFITYTKWKRCSINVVDEVTYQIEEFPLEIKQFINCSWIWSYKNRKK